MLSVWLQIKENFWRLRRVTLPISLLGWPDSGDSWPGLLRINPKLWRVLWIWIHRWKLLVLLISVIVLIFRLLLWRTYPVSFRGPIRNMPELSGTEPSSYMLTRGRRFPRLPWSCVNHTGVLISWWTVRELAEIIILHGRQPRLPLWDRKGLLLFFIIRNLPLLMIR